MSGPTGATGCVAPDVTGVSLTTDSYLCEALSNARTIPLTGPTITPPTPVADTLMPPNLQQAITGCTGVCRFIGYDFDSGVATKASDLRYVVDTYSTTGENSGVLVTKGTKTSGTISGITPDSRTGGSTGTVTYTTDDGQVYTFIGKWPNLLTNGATVTVYYDPANKSKGALKPEDLGFAPPMLIQPPGYELPDFQAADATGTNVLGSFPGVTSVEECAKKCDDTTACTGFNFGGIDTSTVCEIVKDATTNRAYADNKTGFRKEDIPSNPSGLNRPNPPGTDFGNQGSFCSNVSACNTDISRIIQNGVGADTNDIKSFSTSDIESCSYCPVRKFNYDQGRWTVTNEIGITTSLGNKDLAIGALQYSSDGTFADHTITITSGKFYRIGNRIVYTVTEGNGFKLFSYGSLPTAASDSYPNYEVPIFGYLHSNMRNVAVYNSEKLLVEDDKGTYVPVKDLGDHGTRNLAQKFDMMLQPPGKSYDVFSFVPVDYVTNGFRVLTSGGRAIYGDSSTKVYSRYDQPSIYVITEATLQDFLGQIKTSFAIDYPNILHNGANYYKINADNTADTVSQAPFTSTYSSQFTFCQIYANISFDMSTFDWTSNWFTQTGKPSCDRQTKLAYVYKSGLTVPDSFVPGFWSSITQFCTNSCLAGRYAGNCVGVYEGPTLKSVRECKTCSTGKYCPIGATSEQECPFGYYCPTPATKTACRPYGSTCPIGFTYVQDACQGAHSATNDRTKDLTCQAGLCPDGYTWDGGQCIQCLNGGYKSGVSASGAAVSCICPGTGWSGVDCGTCQVDRYISTETTNGVSTSVCIPCPYASTTKGATNVASCTCNDGYTWSGKNMTYRKFYTLLNLPLIQWSSNPIGGYVVISAPSIDGIGPPPTSSTIGDPNDAIIRPTCFPCGVVSTGTICTNILASGTFGSGGGCLFSPATGYTWANPGVDCSVRIVCSVTPAAGYIWTNYGKDCTTKQCPAGSYCPDATTQTACTSGNYCPAGSTSQTQCPAGSYCPTTSTKTTCSAGYSCPAGSTSATACSAKVDGYIWANAGVDCSKAICADGTYFYQENCYSACPASVPYWVFDVYGTDKTRVCKASCPSDRPLIETGNMCVAECGYMFRDGNNCLASCPSTKPYTTPITGSANYNCVASCPASTPYNVPDYYNTCVSTCQNTVAPYLSGTSCVKKCPTTAPYIQGTTCVSVCSGTTPYYNSIDNICISTCPSTKPYVDGNQCVATCPLTDPVTKACVTSCPAARPFKIIDPVTGNICATSCGTYYRESATSYNCLSSCPIGSPPTNGICTQCLSGYYSLTRTMACTQCLAGYYCPDSKTINICGSGKYCPAGSTSENACSAGSYCTTPSTIAACSAGYSCPAGSISPTACGFTPANGSKWANPGVDCTTITCSVPGTFCTGGVQSFCSGSCTGSTYQSSVCTNSTDRVCTTCEAGSYCSNGTKTTCEAGYYCPGGSTRTQCDLGYSCPAGSGSQTKCCIAATSTSTYCSNELSSGYIYTNPRIDCSFRACNAGSYCPNSTTETPCTTGYFCPTGSKSGTLYTYTTYGCLYGTDITDNPNYDCLKPQQFYTNSSYRIDCNITYPNSSSWARYVGIINNKYYCGYLKTNICPSGKTLGTWTDGTQYCY